MTSHIDPLVVDGQRPAIELIAAIPHGMLTQGERLVLTMLGLDSFDGRTAAPGAVNLAAWTGLHVSSVRGILAGLQVPNESRPAMLTPTNRRPGNQNTGRRRTCYRLDIPQPARWSGGSNPRLTIVQPSPNRPGGQEGSVSEPSPNPPVAQAPPLPRDNPSPSPMRIDSEARGLRWGRKDFVKWLAGEEGIPERIAALAVELAASDPDTRSPTGRVRKVPEYRHQIVARAWREDSAAERNARRCAHGVVDGMELDRSIDPSRLCPDCEDEHPRDDAAAGYAVP